MSSQAIASFAATAQAFCAWAEGMPSTPASEASRARVLLAALYDGALALPAGTVTDEPSPPRIGQEAWSALYRRFGALPVGTYACCFEPLTIPPAESTLGDLADDLADIYRDLHAGLLLYGDGRHDEAAWEWRFHFEVHWGQHALDALRALHAFSSSSSAPGGSSAA